VAVESILLTATNIVGGAICSASTGIVRSRGAIGKQNVQDTLSTTIQPDQIKQFDFDLAVQKLVLGDRQTVGLDLALQIGWRRQNSEVANVAILEVPRLVVPMAEPRVLLTVSPAAIESVRAYRLNFLIENPSMHFLTFNITMDASDDFAFSGSKTVALSLVPISRHILQYLILPDKTDQWIEVHLKVVDAYFGQTLKVLAGGEGVKTDKKGGVLIKV
jgi:hypothetical protein